jgi:hypothetical protein
MRLLTIRLMTAVAFGGLAMWSAAREIAAAEIQGDPAVPWKGEWYGSGSLDVGTRTVFVELTILDGEIAYKVIGNTTSVGSGRLAPDGYFSASESQPGGPGLDWLLSGVFPSFVIYVSATYHGSGSHEIVVKRKP